MICRYHKLVESSWHLYESEGLKPDWTSVRSLLSLRRHIIESKIISSRIFIFMRIGKRETDL